MEVQPELRRQQCRVRVGQTGRWDRSPVRVRVDDDEKGGDGDAEFSVERDLITYRKTDEDETSTGGADGVAV